MEGAFLLELLGQVIHSLQTADLDQQPLLVALLHLLQTLPGIGNVLQETHGQEDECMSKTDHTDQCVEQSQAHW